MRFQDETSEPTTNEHVYSGQVLKARENSENNRPIKVKHKGKTYILAPTHPLYNPTKWYGEYEDV